MSARGFRSVGWVAGVAATALGCYMISLQVASTRASLEDMETQIVVAQRDIRVLQTEIGTRGRLAQLENWNVKVLALSAPQATQFLDGGFALAAMVAPKKAIDPAAPVVLASAPAPSTQPVLERDGGADAGVATTGDARSMMHVASLKRELPAADERAAAPKPPKPAASEDKSAARTGSLKAGAKPVVKADTATSAKVDKKVVDKLAPLKTASADSAAKAAKSKESPPKSGGAKTTKPIPTKEAKPKQ